jgi:hypothetical protein
MTNPTADFYVYALHDPRDAERVIYVGMGRDAARQQFATAQQRRSRLLKDAERGIAPVRIVAADLTKEAAIALQIELIAKYGRECDGGPLLNRSLGGPGARGPIVDAQTKVKMSASRKGKPASAALRAALLANQPKAVAAAALINRGRKLSPEVLERRRAGRLAYLARKAAGKTTTQLASTRS